MQQKPSMVEEEKEAASAGQKQTAAAATVSVKLATLTPQRRRTREMGPSECGQLAISYNCPKSLRTRNPVLSPRATGNRQPSDSSRRTQP